MTTPYPPYQPPNEPRIPYNQPHYDLLPAPAPKSIMVLGIIGIVLASLSMMCQSISLMFVMVADPTTSGFEAASTWEIIDAIVRLALAVVLLIASIGVVRKIAWARPMILAWAVAFILLSLASGVINLTTTIPNWIEDQKVSEGGKSSPGFAVGAYCGGAGAMLAFLVYPICVLIFLRKPEVVAAFDRAAVEPTRFGQQ